MKISNDGKHVIYDNYQEYLDHQSMRRNVLGADNPAIFDPEDHPWIVEDLTLFYQYIQPSWLILDVGCRSGWSCMRMKNDGYQRVIGTDIQKDNAVFALSWSIKIELTDAHRQPFANKTFDAVFSRHSLEHMFDPIQVLSECYRLLKSNGILFLVVPLDKEGITNIKFAHSHAFTSPDQILRMVTNFQQLYVQDNGDEIIYVGQKTEKISSSPLQSLKRLLGYK